MTELKYRVLRLLFWLFFAPLPLAWQNPAVGETPRRTSLESTTAGVKKIGPQDDSFDRTPAKDLLLGQEGAHKAEALAHFVEGTAFEEDGEMDKALAAYRKVLDVDPGQSELAARVAVLLSRQDDFPQAIDVLKDAIKA